MRCFRYPALVVFALLVATRALAADLTIGLATDVTALDPHYHNVTPNNNVAAHIFGFLVQRNEKSQLEPSLATEWKTVDPLTWEFKLRKGVKFHDGSDFTAADVVASIERVPTVPEQSFAVHRLQQADQGNGRRRPVHDPLQDGDALSADAVGHDTGRDHIQGRRQGIDRGFQFRQGRDRHRTVQARALRQGRPDRARAQRRLVGRQDAVGEGHAAPAAAGRATGRRVAVGRRAGHRGRAAGGRRQSAQATSASTSIAPSPTASSISMSTATATFHRSSPTRRASRSIAIR